MTRYRLDRETYRAWREKRPSLFSEETTQIGKWLDPPQPDLPEAQPEKPPPLTPAEIRARLLAGESIQSIQATSGTPKHRIQAVKKKHNIPDALPGPRPRCSD